MIPESFDVLKNILTIFLFRSLASVRFFQFIKLCRHCRVAARQFFNRHILRFVVGKAQIVFRAEQRDAGARAYFLGPVH